MSAQDDHIYIEKGGQRLRCGFTTGSCAAAASKAALLMLLGHEDIHSVSVMTPQGVRFIAEIVDISRGRSDSGAPFVSCAVVKDGGDDPDVTSGMRIYARVNVTDSGAVEIDGGEGIGRVTKPGLDRMVGEAAINSVPRSMIEDELTKILKDAEKGKSGVRVVISAPGGEQIAKKTFNPRLGIAGGISILGTTGIVEPMSDEAILKTIRAEMSIKRAEGKNTLIMSPGNYGLKFLTGEYFINEGDVVLFSNFVYDSVRLALDMGFTDLLLVGHLGKLIKVAGGIKNTHSSYGDHRMEILTGIAEPLLPEDERADTISRINECVMTDEAVRILGEAGIREKVLLEVAERIRDCLSSWSDEKVKVEVIVFSRKGEIRAATEGAYDMLKMFR